MSFIPDGGSAFPIETAEEPMEYGMSLRDYFAAKAMAATVSDCEGVSYSERSVAESAYRMANAMLQARKK